MQSLQKLLDIMAALRDPQSGCPWDQLQTFESIAPYTIEEAYEVADAIARNDLDDLRDELGDLLFQVVFHAQMAKEASAFDFNDVAAAIVDKMQRRHPHVFGSEAERAKGAEAGAWEKIKAAEREATADSDLDGIALALPALKRAEKLGKRASGAGFDWPDLGGVRRKINEELRELSAAECSGIAADVEEELGDLLFSVCNLARHLGTDPETALNSANRKFERRYRHMEAALAAKGSCVADTDLDELEAHWNNAKAAESGA